MMSVGIVRVGMAQPRMGMTVTMRLTDGVRRAVGMLVMGVMMVVVGVFHRRVQVNMIMMFSQVQPHAERHQRARDNELNGDRLSKSDQCNGRTDKRRGRKICAGSRRSNMAERKHKENQAESVPKQTHRSGRKNDVRVGNSLASN